jgi:hypothetical protein
MYEQEFEKIWQSQRPHWPDVLDDEFKSKVGWLLFYYNLRATSTFGTLLPSCKLGVVFLWHNINFAHAREGQTRYLPSAVFLPGC